LFTHQVILVPDSQRLRLKSAARLRLALATVQPRNYIGVKGKPSGA
jgi:hypothetical protein